MSTNIHPVVRFWSKVDKSGPCWEWTAGLDQDGYGRAFADNKKYPAHRFSWVLANGRIPPGMLVCHTCDNPKCVRPSHLFLGTHRDNHADRNRKGRQARGERIGNHVLKAAEVAELRKILTVRKKHGWSQQRIADLYGVHQTCVSNIERGFTWAGMA